MRWFCVVYVAALAAAVAFGVRTVDAAAVGGPLSPCPGISQFFTGYRWTNGVVHRGCATGYSVADSSPYTACPSPYGRLYDDRYSVAVSLNVPVLNTNGRPRCGTKVKICGTSCIVALITDRGPYVIGTGGDYGRDFDMSVAARRAIGVNVNLPSWGDPVIIWWRLCSQATPVGATRCSL